MATQLPDHLYKMQRMHKTFAVSSICLALSFLWMLGADYYREWRKYQAEFTKIDVQKTAAQAEVALQEVDQTKLQEVQTSLEAAKADLARRLKEIREAEKELSKKDAVRYRIDQTFRFAKATVDSLRYAFEAKRAEGKPGADEAKEKLDRKVAEMDAARQELLVAEQAVKEVKERIAAMTAGHDEAKTQLEELLSIHDRLMKKLEKSRPNIWTVVRNAPFLDFTAPTQKIMQVVLDDVKNDVNFMEIPRMDRCVTCHFGINRPGFEDQPNPYRTHPRLDLMVGSQSKHPYDSFGCTTCHMGQDRATSFNEAVHWPNDEEQEKEWIARYGWHPPEHWDEPMLSRDHLEASCYKCHAREVRVPEGQAINRSLALIERYGCHGCHKIKGFESLPKVGPDLRAIASKVDETWMMKWLKDPRGFRPSTRMPQFWDLVNTSTPEYLARNEVEADAIVALLFERSERRTQPRPPVAGAVSRGAKLVDEVGCKGCHHVGQDDPVTDRAGLRAFGPELNQLGSKVDAAWLFAWVKNPQAMSPTTRMPNLRLTDQEAADIVAYLLSLRNEEFESRSAPIPDVGTRDRMVAEWLSLKMTDEQAKGRTASMSEQEKRLFLGEKYMNRYGCFGCHLIQGYETASGIGTELSSWGSKYVDQLDFGFLHKAETNPHESIEVEGYGKIDKVEPTRKDWALTKLLNPRVYDAGRVKKPDEKLKMPSFGLSREDANGLVRGLLAFTKEKVDLRKMHLLDAARSEIEAGRRIVLNRNCEGCHKIGSEGGAVTETVKTRFVREGMGAEDAEGLAQSYSPPNLQGEGGKVHPDWFFRFLRQPVTIRPWLSLRMPTFELTDAEQNAIITQFARLSNEDYPFKYRPFKPLGASDQAAAQKMISKDYFDCLNCHMQGDKRPEGPPSGWAPDLQMARQRLQPDWIVRWLRDPQKLQPGTKMPTFYDPGDPKSSAPPDILGGDPERQIDVLKDHVLSLGRSNDGN